MLIKVNVLFLLLFSSVNSFALEIKSEWVQGGMIFGKVLPTSSIEFLGRKVKVNPQGDFVVGLGRDTKATIELVEKQADGMVKRHTFSVKQRKYREQRIEGVPKRTVHVNEKELPRIRKEVKLTKAARKVHSNRQDFLQTFIWPAKGIISGVYGSRRYYNGVPKRPHYGLDIAAPKGSPVIAPASGVITLVHENMYFSGGTIIMDHGHGISSTFIHLHKAHVKKGDIVEQGQLIAEIGTTGRSTGPHLDWRMNWFKQRLDPQLLMADIPLSKHQDK